MANSVVGLGLASPPVQLSNTVNAISQKYIVPVLGDNVFKPSPVFWALTRDGKKFGAGELVFPEINQEELPGGAYYGDQLLELWRAQDADVEGIAIETGGPPRPR